MKKKKKDFRHYSYDIDILETRNEKQLKQNKQQFFH